MQRSGKLLGRLVAKALSGAWRPAAPPLGVSGVELDTMAPLLCVTGAGALVWRRIRETWLEFLPAADALRQNFRLQVLEAGRKERDILTAFDLLRSARIEPLLFKGWAAARLYPEKGLRPWGDVDLYVRPRDYGRALDVIKEETRVGGALGSRVDLYHRDFEDLNERGIEELYARSLLVPLGDTEVRVPGEADHLRLLCLHWLRHHAWRPLWLCDIAAALENRSADFDWDVCLGRRSGNDTVAGQRDWIICALALARELLGPRIDGDAPDAVREAHAPRWLVRAVLKQWESPAKQHRPDNLPILTLLRRRRAPGVILRALRDRWPNPIEATYGRRRLGPFTRQPQLPYQLGLYLARAVRLQARLPGLLQREEF